ncbi:hypothetical protein DERP_011942 [Dermatophagoides pteronyssinus]|uniref:Uncharacterized protein n=1 Tax=Dermatophagoides pteronyssinus TaxID=6956 RepID=A0ABQ8J2N1_DERPT|nr:hypothetical protein DERP_011942 [Dermatophagoides pteronyssinus]
MTILQLHYSICSPSTVSLILQLIFLTIPFDSAIILFCIFIASITHNSCPSFTCGLIRKKKYENENE